MLIQNIDIGKKENIERSESSALGLRVIIGQKSAVVSANELSSKTCDELVDRCVSMANLAPEDPYLCYAKPDEFATAFPDLDLYDDYEPTIESLDKKAKETEDIALSVEGITNSEGASASYGCNEVALITSNGFSYNYKTTSNSLSDLCTCW